jgi:antitoxin Phd
MSSPAFDITTRLSELVETALKDGPQIVTQDGVETAVLVSIEDWKHLQSARSQTEADPLTDPNGPHDIYISPSSYLRIRPAEFND